MRQRTPFSVSSGAAEEPAKEPEPKFVRSRRSRQTSIYEKICTATRVLCWFVSILAFLSFVVWVIIQMGPVVDHEHEEHVARQNAKKAAMNAAAYENTGGGGGGGGSISRNDMESSSSSSSSSTSTVGESNSEAVQYVTMDDTDGSEKENVEGDVTPEVDTM